MVMWLLCYYISGGDPSYSSKASATSSGQPSSRAGPSIRSRCEFWTLPNRKSSSNSLLNESAQLTFFISRIISLFCFFKFIVHLSHVESTHIPSTFGWNKTARSLTRLTDFVLHFRHFQFDKPYSIVISRPLSYYQREMKWSPSAHHRGFP
jgi:hypothetical protein